MRQNIKAFIGELCCACNLLVDYSMTDMLAWRGRLGKETVVQNDVGSTYEVEFKTSPGGAVISAAVAAVD